MKSFRHSHLLLFRYALLFLISWTIIIVSTLSIDLDIHSIYATFLISLSAILFAVYRSGFFSYPTFIVFIAVYPLIAVLLIKFYIGFPLFSSFGREFQDAELLFKPLLIASLSGLFLSFSLSDWREKITIENQANINYDIHHKEIKIFLFLFLMTFFVFLSEPSFNFIGVSEYSEIMVDRNSSFNFANGAWVVVFVLVFGLLKKRYVVNILLKNILFCICSVSFIFLLLQGRRIEVLSVLIFVFLSKSRSMSFVKGATIFLVIVSIMATIGVLRNRTDDFGGAFSSVFEKEYADLPDGSLNMIVGFVAGINLDDEQQLLNYPGETYAGQFLRLPPAFLGLPRPETPYEYVADKTTLMGGEYYLLEPYLNFGGLGIVLYLIIFSILTNLSIKNTNNFLATPKNIFLFVISATFLTHIFRTMWYGVTSIIKGEIMALLICVSLYFINKTFKQKNT